MQRARTPCTSCTFHPRMTRWFCKHLMADSDRYSSVSRCPEVQFSDLTHHHCAPMPTDETRPMDNGDGKPSRKYFSEDGRGNTEPVSVHRYSCDAVLCLYDQSRHLERNMEVITVRLSRSFITLQYQFTHPVHYRVYTKDGPLKSNHPIYSNDPFISRIASSSVRPPHTAASLMRCLCRIEGLAQQNCILFQSLSEMTALNDSIHLSLRGPAGPGASDLDPMALVVDKRAADRRSQVTNSVELQELFEWNYEQRYGAAP